MGRFTISPDPLFGTAEDEILFSLPKDSDYYFDIIYGGKGNDTIFGGELDDELFGGAGDDSLYGGLGDDFLHGGEGSDQFYGGTGEDTVSYESANNGVYIALGLGYGRAGANGDTYDSIENVVGTRFDDMIFGSHESNTIYGAEGYDYLSGEAGNDTLYGGADNDILWGGDDTDWLYGGDGYDILVGGKGHDVLEGGTGPDHLAGGAGNDNLDGGDGDDLLFGEDQDDFIFGGDGQDTIDGGDGNDTAAFNQLVLNFHDIYVDLQAEAVLDDGNGFFETIRNVENVRADGSGNVTLYGSAGDNFLAASSALGGQITIDGRGGSDSIELRNIGGNQIEGGAGIDQLHYDLNQGIEINLLSGVAHSAGQIDAINGIENALGGFGNDILTGNGADNYLDGGTFGDDVLSGGGGADTLRGGPGNDTMTGGADADLFLYTSSSSFPGALDTITDFEIGMDTLDLSGTPIANFAEFEARSMQTGSDVIVDTGHGNELVLQNILLGDLSASDFLF